MSEWISVKDRLPEGIWHLGGCSPQATLIAAYNKRSEVNPVESRYAVYEAFYQDDKKVFFDKSFIDITEQVTHWMPLPEPPE